MTFPAKVPAWPRLTVKQTKNIPNAKRVVKEKTPSNGSKVEDAHGSCDVVQPLGRRGSNLNDRLGDRQPEDRQRGEERGKAAGEPDTVEAITARGQRVVVVATCQEVGKSERFGG